MTNKMTKQLMRLWHDRATVEQYVTDKIDGETVNVKKELYADIKCKVSLRIQRTVGFGGGLVAETEYDAKVYVTPDLVIPDGCVITVTDVNMRVTEYVGSRAFCYPSHQEIYLWYKDKVRV